MIEYPSLHDADFRLDHMAISLLLQNLGCEVRQVKRRNKESSNEAQNGQGQSEIRGIPGSEVEKTRQGCGYNCPRPTNSFIFQEIRHIAASATVIETRWLGKFVLQLITPSSDASFAC
jgi:hypothetical protein